MPQFSYVYVLRSQCDALLYIGSTRDLKKRLALHNAGAITATRPRRPLELIFFEAYRNECDAKRREAYFKTSKGKTTLRTMLREFLRTGDLQQPPA
jgi:putative endonuclease